MTDAQLEFLKILLDKGLLALILLCAGYYLNRAIERYKAKNIYFQNVSEARIQAYLAIGKSLASEYLQSKHIKREIVSLVKMKSDSPERKEKARKLKAAVKKRGDRVRMNTITITMYGMFFSPEVGDAIAEFHNTSAEIFQLEAELYSNASFQEWDDYAVKLEELHKELQKSFYALNGKLKNDINASPFG